MTQISTPETANHDLTVDMQRVIGGLIAGKTINDACAEAGVSRSSYYRWTAGGTAPQFVAALNRQRAEAVESIRSSVQHLAATAVSTLSEILGNEKAPAGARVRAAVAVLDQMGKQHAPDKSPTTIDQVLKKQTYDFVRGMMSN